MSTRLRYRLPVACAALALALSLALSPVLWMCRDGRPCAFDCSHGVDRAAAFANQSSHGHACCPVATRTEADEESLIAGMACRALAAARIGVTTATVTVPHMAAVDRPSATLSPVPISVAYAIATDDDRPPGGDTRCPTDPRAPPITS